MDHDIDLVYVFLYESFSHWSKNAQTSNAMHLYLFRRRFMITNKIFVVTEETRVIFGIFLLEVRTFVRIIWLPCHATRNSLCHFLKENFVKKKTEGIRWESISVTVTSNL